MPPLTVSRVPEMQPYAPWSKLVTQALVDNPPADRAFNPSSDKDLRDEINKAFTEIETYVNGLAAGGGTGDITDVLAGAGLSGGGASGSVTLALQGYAAAAQGNSPRKGNAGVEWFRALEDDAAAFRNVYAVGTTYAAGEYVVSSLTRGDLYRSKVSANTGNALTDATKWERVATYGARLAFMDLVNGVFVAEPRTWGLASELPSTPSFPGQRYTVVESTYDQEYVSYDGDAWSPAAKPWFHAIFDANGSKYFVVPTYSKYQLEQFPTTPIAGVTFTYQKSTDGGTTWTTLDGSALSYATIVRITVAGLPAGRVCGSLFTLREP